MHCMIYDSLTASQWVTRLERARHRIVFFALSFQNSDIARVAHFETLHRLCGPGGGAFDTH